MTHGREGERISLALGLSEEEVDSLLDLILSYGVAVKPRHINTVARLHRRLRNLKQRLQELKHPELKNETPAESESSELPNRQD